MRIRAGASGQAEYEILTRLDLPAGRYQLRASASIPALGTSGSVYADVDVPEVDRSPISLSSVVFDASPRPIVSPLDAFKGVLAIVPTNRRVFEPGDRVAASVRVYQAGKAAPRAVGIRFRLLDSAGAPAIDRAEAMAPHRFAASRAADRQIDVPVSRLAPGDYLLVVEADAGAARREARLRVR